MKDMIRVENLAFKYDENIIFKEVSFSLKKGLLCALIGANGSGKSTLLQCCMNFLKPFGGEIYIDEESSLKKPPSWMAKRVAYVPQDTNLSFSYSALEIVLMGRSPYMGGVFGLKKRDYEIANSALEIVGLDKFANTSCSHLSGGQKQLILIARALAQETPLIILDEPASALDYKNQNLLWQILREIVKNGTTILVCTHEPNHVLWFCDEVLVLSRDGNLIAKGEPKSTINKDVLEKTYDQKCLIHDFYNQKFAYPENIIEEGYLPKV